MYEQVMQETIPNIGSLTELLEVEQKQALARRIYELVAKC